VLNTRPDIEPIYQRLGAAVLELRTEAGWTQQDLAGQIGLTRASVANVETGRQRLMLHQIEALADVFNVSIGRLLGVAIDTATESERVKKLRSDLAEARADKASLAVRLDKIARIAELD
jgi:transcriptional regulator with XRE-family HTH domain